ncbi:MAG: DNA repair protein RecN [Woeseiaceae bacterium]|nr:DNA repair protein RecN [Woeseiaceae bacterium]|tara:strand:- start:211 stop:1875 length:1665 start_codon:yes stop_codon:yes gene_type:complete
MLRSLQAKNFAIIDEIDIVFSEGMIVLTGETGAGKSILVDALSLVLGERGGANLIRDNNKRAEFTAEFVIDEHAKAKTWLSKQSLDDDHDCVLRRIVNPDGRSRAFINGNQVNLQTLKALGELLVDIHGQHFHQSLGKTDVQRELIDHFGDLIHIKDDVKNAFNKWSLLAKKLLTNDALNKDRDARIDLLNFQYEELNTLELQENEYNSISLEFTKIHNIEKLNNGINQVLNNLQDSEITNAESLINNSVKSLESLIEFDHALKDAKNLLEEASIQSSEAADYLRRYCSSIEFDPEKNRRLDERINTIKTIARKHRVEPSELHTVYEKIKNELNELKNIEANQKNLNRDIDEAKNHYTKLAKELSRLRIISSNKLSKAVTKAMSSLGMPDGQFNINITSNNAISSHGMDDVIFLLSANPGQAPQSIAKIASGGELSRMSLAIQVIASEGNYIPTMVFDEVDSGVGGAVAEMVGRRLSELGVNRQVLCVTHLPQVASQANSHFRINKLSDGKSTKVHVTQLNKDSRIGEIARMLGGIEVTERTRDHAAEMLLAGK